MPQFPLGEAPGEVLNSLAEALDQADIGIMLLDRDLRVRFVNRRQIELFGLPPALLAARPNFRDFLDHAAARSGFAVPAADIPEYIERREAAVRAGPIPPVHIDFIDGRRLRLACGTCAGGGRILTYTDISLEARPEMLDALAQINADLRFSNEMMEDHAAQLATLAEATDESAHKIEAAKQELEREIIERRELEARLRWMATTDGLTGALNRSGFMTLSQTALERDGGGLALMMLDVDHFKSINDRYGHAGGDLALRHLVNLVGGQIRRGDLLGRLGGEEFAVLLPAIAIKEARTIAERLVSLVASSPVTFGDTSIGMTVSIGIAVATSADCSIEQVIARADDALYRAKGSGRNRVVLDRRMEAA
jgi:diguanylate cyclase (GGDEF)-like protein